MFGALIDYMNRKFNPQTRGVLLQYIETELCAWFQSHIENGLTIIRLRNALRYYLSTKDVERIFSMPEESVVEVFSEESLTDDAKVLYLKDKPRIIYSEDWRKVVQQKLGIFSYLGNKLFSPNCEDKLTIFLNNWPIFMLREYKEKLKKVPQANGMSHS